ncbi:MAG: hypothetical protein ACOYBW_10660 [Fluviibacter phosphoraccumulans]
MDAATTAVLINITCGVLANFSTDAIKAFFSKAIGLKPALEQAILEAKTSADIESIFKEALGVIDASAGSGAIEVDGALIEAIRGIRFDHEHGLVHISGSTVQAPVLVTGGGVAATGKTTIGANTVLKSKGTSIDVGNGCSIVMSGNAKITQS